MSNWKIEPSRCRGSTPFGAEFKRWFYISRTGFCWRCQQGLGLLEFTKTTISQFVRSPGRPDNSNKSDAFGNLNVKREFEFHLPDGHKSHNHVTPTPGGNGIAQTEPRGSGHREQYGRRDGRRSNKLQQHQCIGRKTLESRTWTTATRFRSLILPV